MYSPLIKKLLFIVFIVINFSLNIKANLDSNIVFIESKETLLQQIKQFQGKLIYLDIYTTWCGPCRKQFKYKNELNDFFDKRDIVSLYICIDTEEKRETHKELVISNNLHGYHVLVNADSIIKYKDGFPVSHENYKMLCMRFPQYLIIDKNGNVLNEDAPRPENKDELITQLSEIKYYTWPVKGLNSGTGIINKPQDFIENEINFSDLFITAEEGTEIVSPTSGKIISYTYNYYNKLIYVSSFSHNYNDSLSIEEYDKYFRENVAIYNKYNPQYLSLSITIESKNKERISISGLRPIKFFKTGEYIAENQVIGKLGYSYHKINIPSIMISRSVKGKVADPMSIFGIKSTFKYPHLKLNTNSNSKKIKDKLLSDFEIFRNALEEGHPGLYDYISKPELDSIFDMVKLKINDTISNKQFQTLLSNVVKSIKDSHTALLTDNKKGNLYPPILFGLKKDKKLYVYSTISNYNQYINKQIIEINNEKVENIIPKIMNIIYGNDGFIKSIKERRLLTSFWKDYYKISKNQKNDSINIKFSDGTSCLINYSNYNINDYSPTIAQKDTVNYRTKIIDSQIALLDINSFDLLNTEVDSIRMFINKISKTAFETLIIDVRNNQGGSQIVLDSIFSFIAIEPFKSTQYYKVNKSGSYNLFNNTLNYTSQFELFNDFTKTDKGWVKYFKEISPSKNTHFNKNIIVLANEFSLSAATIFTALVRKHKRGVIIGRETGSCYHSINAIKFAQVFLENSRTELYMPLVKSVFEEKENSNQLWGRGVIPDIEIELCLQEIFGKSDLILNKAIELKTTSIKKENDSNVRFYIILILSVFIIIILFFYLRSRKNKV